MKILTTWALYLSATLLANGQVTIIQKERHLASIKKGQKIFLERGDYLKDKILRITDKADTVLILEADKTFFKFKQDSLIAWSLTAQVDENDGIITRPAVYDIKMPFDFILVSNIYVYSQAKLGANKILDLKKGKTVSVTAKDGVFFRIKYKDVVGYIVESEILPIKTQHPIRKALNEISNSIISSTTAIKSSGHSYTKGPKGGCYYINSAGKKVYVDHSYCN